jgi:hypothetical protein
VIACKRRHQDQQRVGGEAKVLVDPVEDELAHADRQEREPCRAEDPRGLYDSDIRTT